MAKSGIAIIIAVSLFLAAASANAFVAFPRAVGYDRATGPTSFPANLWGRPGPLIEGDRTNFTKPSEWNDGIHTAVTAPPVPEPATVVMVGFGLAAIGMARRKFLR